MLLDGCWMDESITNASYMYHMVHRSGRNHCTAHAPTFPSQTSRQAGGVGTPTLTKLAQLIPSLR